MGLEHGEPQHGPLEHRPLEHEEPEQAEGEWRCEEVKRMAHKRQGQVVRVGMWLTGYEGAQQVGH